MFQRKTSFTKGKNFFLLFILLLPFLFLLFTAAGPAAAEPGEQIAEVYPLPSHTFVLTENGSVWAWGDNQNGKLGDGTTTSRATPVQPQLDEVEKLYPQAAGHTFALKKDGTLWAWERNWDGRLGTGIEEAHHSTPVQILEDVDKVFPGSRHSFALKYDGSLWGWGKNSHGQVGDGTTANRFEPVLIDLDTPVQVVPGDNNTFAILKNGSLWAWGNNQYGKLGDGTTSSRSKPVKITEDVKNVYPQTNHTIAYKNDQTIWSWGHNWYGQLGTGSNENRAEPAQVNLAQVTNVYSEQYHTFALKSDGTLWSWGHNWYGQLGDGTITNRHQPVQVSLDNIAELHTQKHHTFALQENNVLWGWGRNWDGRIGDNSNAHIRPTPVQVSDNINNTYVLEKHAFAMDNNDTTLAWGDNGKSQLGNGSAGGTANPYPLDLEDVATIYPQDSHTFAQKKDGSLWAWGDNSKGQLGVGNYQRQEEPVQVLLGSDLPAYTISLSANPPEGGVLSGDGEYRHGQSVNISASAIPGYSFINWTEDGEEISTETEFSFLAAEDRNLVANFKAPPEDEAPVEEEAEEETAESFEISLTADPEDGGTVEGAGTFEEGSDITVNAEASEGYLFLNWSEIIPHNGLNGDTDEVTDLEVVVSEDKDYKFEVKRNRELTANFEALEEELPSPGITEISAENGSITITFDQDFNEEPALDHFTAHYLAEKIKQTGDEPMGGFDMDLGNEETDFYQFDMDNESQDDETRFFEQDPTNEDEIESDQENNQTWFQDNTNNDDEQAIEEPEETESGTEDQADSDSEEKAEDNGTETDETESDDNWQALELSSLDWEQEQPETVTLNFEQFVPAESDISYTIEVAYLEEEAVAAAPFTVEAKPAPTYQLSLVADPEEAGTLDGEGSYEEGEEITISAEADEAYEFINWNSDEEIISTEGEFTYTMPGEDAILTANFEAKPAPTYQLSLLAEPEEAGTLDGEGNYEEGEEITISAEAEEGYEFINWSLDEEIISTEGEFTYTVPDENATLTATFEAKSDLDTITDTDEDTALTEDLEADPDIYYLELAADPGHRGNVKGEGIYEHGEEAIVIAEPEPNYFFNAWLDGDEIISHESEYSFKVTSDLKLVAQFEQEENTFYVSLNSNPENAGVLYGEGVYVESEEALIKAVANEGYKFTGWSEDGETISEEADYSFEVTGDLELTANFELKSNDTENDDAMGGSDEYTDRTGLAGSSFESNSMEVIDHQEADPATTFNIELLLEPDGHGIVKGAGEYEKGKLVGLDAEPKEGYRFSGWLEAYPSSESEDDDDDGDVEYVMVSQAKKYAFEANRDRTLTAAFETLENRNSESPETFEITLSSRPRMGGKVYGSGDYTEGEKVTITALPDIDFQFINWTENGEEVSTDIIYTFQIEKDLELKANFEPIDDGYFIEPSSSSYNDHDPFLDSYLAEYLLPGATSQWSLPQGGNRDR